VEISLEKLNVAGAKVMQGILPAESISKHVHNVSRYYLVDAI
jgi:hypothetical protein